MGPPTQLPACGTSWVARDDSSSGARRFDPAGPGASTSTSPWRRARSSAIDPSGSRRHSKPWTLVLMVWSWWRKRPLSVWPLLSIPLLVVVATVSSLLAVNGPA